MKPLRTAPVTPPLSPLAEVVLAFEDSEPDACTLLQPFNENIKREELEVRSRRQFPQRTPEQRSVIIDKALELLELARQGKSASRSRADQQTASPPISPEEREQLRGMLENALREDPGFTAKQGIALINTQRTVPIPTGTFYGTYWKPVINRLPKSVRDLRNELTSLRPGNRNLDLTDKRRADVRNIVAAIKRDHPDFHYGQIMDEVRRTTPYQFSDPVSFNRHYVATVLTAPPRKNPSVARPARTKSKVLREQYSVNAELDTIINSVTIAPEQTALSRHTRERTIGILTEVDPLSPTQFVDDGTGGMRLQITFRAMARADVYRMTSLFYSALAEAAEIDTPNLPSVAGP